MRAILTGRGSEIVEVIPTRCPAGHELKPGTVLIGGDVTKRTVLCRVCGLQLVSRHDSDTWYVVQQAPG